jgi:hypothetical protein
MTPPRIPSADGQGAVFEVLGGFDTPAATQPTVAVPRPTLAMAVRYLLQTFENAHPGHSVEVRVPPFGAVQAVEGPRHTRGTPANVVELGPLEWVRLATGSVTWAELASSGKLSASGIRSDISELLPLAEW